MVKLDQVVAVSGQANLFKLIASRANGLILEDYVTKKTNFYSARTFQFSPLESISMFTMADNIPLKDVYERFLSKESEKVVPFPSDGDVLLKQFFAERISEYDPYRVHVKDIRKAIKWYHQLKELGFITEEKELSTEEETEILPSEEKE